jgi:hypothetical protein
MEATLQNIFRADFESYKKRHGLSMDQHRAAQAIMACQSEALGHEEWACLNDGHTERQYHSCRHRSCPRCHNAKTHDWLERIQARLIPCDHYHVVFTLPHELNPLWQYNRSWCGDHLLKVSAETLKQLLADEKYLGAEAGMLAALHTWGRTLSFHPHVHVLVSGGGLDGEGWRAVKNDFLLPVGVIKAKFRGKWISWLNAAYDAGKITLPPEWTEAHWRKALRSVSRKNWNVRIQGGYRHGRGVANYLSRYMRGGPIKDHRIVSAGRTVIFRYRDHADGAEKTMELSTEHFLSRVLWHVPVKGQHTVRYYGLYRPGAGAKRQRIRECLGVGHEEQPGQCQGKPHECPACGRPMFHRLSVRGKFSYIKNTDPTQRVGNVQQGVEVDRDSVVGRRRWRPEEGAFVFLGRAPST